MVNLDSSNQSSQALILDSCLDNYKIQIDGCGLILMSDPPNCAKSKFQRLSCEWSKFNALFGNLVCSVFIEYFLFQIKVSLKLHHFMIILYYTKVISKSLSNSHLISCEEEEMANYWKYLHLRQLSYHTVCLVCDFVLSSFPWNHYTVLLSPHLRSRDSTKKNSTKC